MRNKIEKNNCYVYVYLDPRMSDEPLLYQYYDYQNSMYPNCYEFPLEPFYVGVGTKGRILDHFYSAKNLKSKDKNLFKIRKIQKIIKQAGQPVVLILKNNLSRKEANNLEKTLIKLIGRSDLGLGPLTNLTDGGDGGDTWKGISETTKIQRKEDLSKALLENGNCGRYERTKEIKT
jgi:hypothetical protein